MMRKAILCGMIKINLEMLFFAEPMRQATTLFLLPCGIGYVGYSRGPSHFNAATTDASMRYLQQHHRRHIM
jgi:hypothetical protein